MQGVERQTGSGSSGTASKTSEHVASSGSRSGDTSSGSAARSADQAEAGRLQSEPHAVPVTKQAAQSAGQQRTVSLLCACLLTLFTISLHMHPSSCEFAE